ncbi:septum formation family protein [Arthrobacter pigmenti]
MSNDSEQPPDRAAGESGNRQSRAPAWYNVPPPPSRPPSNSGGAGQEPDPTPPTSAWQATPYQEPPTPRSRKKTSKAPLFLGIGVAAALIVGVVLIATMLSGTGETEAEPAPDSNGVIAEEVSPFDFEEGQCFTDFSNATEPATVVTCETPHKAQLVNTFDYEEGAEFPGEEALAQKAEELCRNTQLSEEASRYEGQLRQQTAYPQTESWQEGDRRVDCFIRITNGEITGSLID